MAKFQIGQEVVCVNVTITAGTFIPLIKGKIYTVLTVKYCHACGEQLINVGYTYNKIGFIGSNFICYTCDNMVFRAYTGESVFHASSRFRSLEEMTCTSEEIEELLNSSVMTK